MAFTSLNHYLDVEWMEYAYECTRKDGAVGVDGQTAEEYAVDLQHNLTDLIDRLKSGRYRAPPVRRHYIDKPGGDKRGLGIPSFEDKLAQRAIVMLLEPIYEQDFRAPCKGTVIQWVRIPPGNCRFSRKQPKQPHKERWLEPSVQRVALGDSATMQAVM